MTIVIRSREDDVIAIPARLLEGLLGAEGSEIKVVLDGQVLRLTPLDQFLALRGLLQNDNSFDEAIQSLNKAWQSWTTQTSA